MLEVFTIAVMHNAGCIGRPNACMTQVCENEAESSMPSAIQNVH